MRAHLLSNSYKSNSSLLNFKNFQITDFCQIFLQKTTTPNIKLLELLSKTISFLFFSRKSVVSTKLSFLIDHMIHEVKNVGKNTFWYLGQQKPTSKLKLQPIRNLPRIILIWIRIQVSLVTRCKSHICFV